MAKPKRGRSLLAKALIPFGSVIFLIGWILFYFGLNRAEKRIEDTLKNKKYSVMQFEVYSPQEQKVKSANV